MRPRYLTLRALLFEISLPVTAWVSILHRVSGVVMLLMAGAGLYLLDLSLGSEAGFAEARATLDSPMVKLSALGLLWALFHHLAAGLRVLLLDLGVGVERTIARQSGFAVLCASLVATTVVTVWLW